MQLVYETDLGLQECQARLVASEDAFGKFQVQQNGNEFQIRRAPARVPLVTGILMPTQAGTRIELNYREHSVFKAITLVLLVLGIGNTIFGIALAVTNPQAQPLDWWRLISTVALIGVPAWLLWQLRITDQSRRALVKFIVDTLSAKPQLQIKHS